MLIERLSTLGLARVQVPPLSLRAREQNRYGRAHLSHNGRRKVRVQKGKKRTTSRVRGFPARCRCRQLRQQILQGATAASMAVLCTSDYTKQCGTTMELPQPKACKELPFTSARLLADHSQNTEYFSLKCRKVNCCTLQIQRVPSRLILDARSP